MHYKNKYFIAGVVTAVMFVFCNESMSQSGWYQLQSGTSSILNSTFFVDASTGYMVGNNIAIKTVNGGYNWQVLPNLGGGSCVYFVNALTGYVCSGSIFKTTDGGISWIDLNCPNIKSVYFEDANTGYGDGNYNTIVKTTNGGLSWITQEPYLSNYNLKTVFFTTSQTGYAAGGVNNGISSHGIIYKTTNGGNNWVQNNLECDGIEFCSVYFPVRDTGYIVGGQTSGISGVIYKTFDAGTTWIQQAATDHFLNSVYFVNSRTGYAAGNGGMVLKTIDGSVIWNSQLDNSQKNINSIYFVADNVGFTAGADGTVQKTVNGGTQGPPYAVSGFIHYQIEGTPVVSGKVYAVNYNRSTGTITYVDTAAIQNGVYQFRHVPQDSTYIAAYQDDEESGLNATTRLDFVPTFYGDTITWANAHVLYIGGNLTNININVPKINNPGTANGHIGGGVYAQNNNNPLALARVYARIGNTYINYGTSLSSGAYIDAFLPQGNYQLICDRFGYRSASRNVTLGNVNLDTINFYLVTFNPIGIQNHGSVIPSSYKLEQNYPNPFNPSTKIKFDIPETRNTNAHSVQLRIYDVLGKEIALLLNEQLKPGTYEVDWNASIYPSGLYFYKLTTDNFSQTKKMLMIK